MKDVEPWPARVSDRGQVGGTGVVGFGDGAGGLIGLLEVVTGSSAGTGY